MMRKLILSLLLVFPVNSFAASQYRCNGKIQYRPCNQQIIVGRPVKYTSGTRALINAQQNSVKASFKYQAAAKDTNGPLYADIVSANYQKYPKRKDYGQWRGVVKGNGDIHLSLLISKQGAREENRYMGHVKLKEDQTSFNFISSPPDSGVWSWKILAVPK